MASVTALRVTLLVSFSVFLSVLLGFGFLTTKALDFPEISVTQCVVVLCLIFVLRVTLLHFPRGEVEVKGQAVFVTGCDSGFGHAFAKRLHKRGFTVFAACLLKDKGGEGAKQLDEFNSDRMKVIQLDVCSEEQVNQAVKFIKDNLEDPQRGLWAVVNNAGIAEFGHVEFSSMDISKRMSEVNLWGTIRVTKAVLPLIRKAKGRVVNIASMFGRISHPLWSAYCVSKYGVEAFSDCLRYEMKEWGIKVSIVEPGNFVRATSIISGDAMTNVANKLWNEVPPDVKEAYGKNRLEQHIAEVRAYCSSGENDMTPVLDDLMDAVTSKRPYTRYNPTQPYWWIRQQLMTHLSAAISDALYF